MFIEKTKSTNFEHGTIYQLATYLGQPFTTGSYEPNHAKTEIMALLTGEWEVAADYPYHPM